MIPSRRLAPLLACLPVLLVCGSLSPGQQAPSKPTGPGTKAWVGRYQEVEEYLRTAECVRMEELGPAVSLRRCVLRPGGPVARMAFKLLPPGTHRGFRDSYKNDIAAYELDKLLRMDMVPPAVERELMGHKGAAIFWVEGVGSWNAGTSPGESDRTHWEGQLVRTRMFDDLIGNRDRNRGNLLHDAAWNLVLIDHSRAFGSETGLPHKLTRIDRDYWARIESLTRQQLDATLRPWLTDDEIDAILSRRERMRADVAALRE